MFSFSDNSNKELDTATEDLQLVMRESIKVTKIDFGVVNGHRSTETQNEYYKAGKSKIDGITKLSKHNVLPSKAVDIFAYIDGRANWEVENMSYLAGVILSTAERLYQEGKIKNKIRWGGNWGKWNHGVNYNGFVDTPHYEEY